MWPSYIKMNFWAVQTVLSSHLSQTGEARMNIYRLKKKDTLTLCSVIFQYWLWRMSHEFVMKIQWEIKEPHLTLDLSGLGNRLYKKSKIKID